MSKRESPRPAPPVRRMRETMTSGLADLIAANPQLTLADILALWGWIGPSTQVH
jgi:hypothetical protein